MATLPWPRGDEYMEKPAEQIQIRSIDYQELARRSGEEAYQTAKRIGLSEERAQKLKEVCGEPDPEFQL